MNAPRIIKNINCDWRFRYFPRDEILHDNAETDCDDSRWKPVAVPHNWNVYETTGELHPFIRDASEMDSKFWWHGWGWYRKVIGIGAEHKDKRVFTGMVKESTSTAQTDTRNTRGWAMPYRNGYMRWI